MPNRDTVLLETVKTHRARLLAAFLFGQLAERRVVNDNLKRLIGGVVLAAVACAGCVGFSFVASLRAGQAAAQQQQAGLGPATGASFAADTFDRRTDRGWGTAERGGAWTMTGPAADYRVTSGGAVLDLPDAEVRGGYLGSVLQDRTDVTVTVQRRTGASEGDVLFSLVGRRVSRTQDYRANVVLGAGGTVAVALARRSDPTRPDEPAEASLSDTVLLMGSGAPAAGAEPAPVSVRLQVVGTNPTTVRAKIWLGTGGEPAGWTVSASDSVAGLQRPGAVGFTAVRSGDGAATLDLLDLVARVAP
ncbi:MAG TPA: hypothetical protein VF642_08050 [Propionibacteriaceae bacterium]